MKKNIFLSATWEYLAMINYQVDPFILKSHIPPYTEIDLFEGKALVSLVGFLFNNTKVFGINWPMHTHFEEVNLRYYLKHFDGKQWKRGVCFVSEIVPRPFIAYTANFLFNEHYRPAKMFHNIRTDNNQIITEYNWKCRKQEWNFLGVNAGIQLQDIIADSEEEFIFEHYFGYNKFNNTTTIEYSVSHPRWQVYPVHDYLLKCNVAKLYGNEFVPFIVGVKPHSIFLAKGSHVTVSKPKRIKTDIEFKTH